MLPQQRVRAKPGNVLPPASRNAHWRPGLHVTTLSAGWVLIATCVQLARGSGYGPVDVVWAEDGGVFLNQAMRAPLWQNLSTPHAGYLQVICRLLAQPAAYLPLSWAAWWFAVAAAVVVVLISLLVWFASRDVLRSRWARVLLTVFVPVLPQAGFETNANVANLHWYLAYAAFWVLLAAPKALRWQLGASVVVVLAVLSDPLTVLVLPATVVGVIVHRRVSCGPPIAMLLALLVQAWVVLGTGSSLRATSTSLADLVGVYALRVVTSAATGDRVLESLYPRWGVVAVALLSLAVLVGVLLAFWKTGSNGRWVAGLALGVSVVYLCVPIALRGTGSMLESESFGLSGSRYALVPLLLFWVGAIVLLDGMGHRFAGRSAGKQLNTSAVLGTAISVLLGIQVLSDWPMATARTDGPVWTDTVRTAEDTCAGPPGTHGPQQTPRIAWYDGGGAGPLVPGPDEVTLVVAPPPPPHKPVDFAVVAPCAKLRS